MNMRSALADLLRTILASLLIAGGTNAVLSQALAADAESYTRRGLGRDAVARTSIPPALGLRRGHRVRRKVPGNRGDGHQPPQRTTAEVVAKVLR